MVYAYGGQQFGSNIPFPHIDYARYQRHSKQWIKMSFTIPRSILWQDIQLFI